MAFLRTVGYRNGLIFSHTLGRYLCHPERNNLKDFYGKLFYSTTMKDRNSWVVLSDNGKMIVCWHPEEAPPYEHTKPLPYIEPELREGDSVLKVQYRREAKYRFQPDGPTKPELAKMTFTTVHRWNPNRDKKFVDPDPPVDREGI